MTETEIIKLAISETLKACNARLQPNIGANLFADIERKINAARAASEQESQAQFVGDEVIHEPEIIETEINGYDEEND